LLSGPRPRGPAILLLGLLPIGACSGQTETKPSPPVVFVEEVPVTPPDLVATGGAFLVLPYLQLGDHPSPTTPECLTLLWHADDRDDDWSVEVRATPAGPWAATASPTSRRVAVPGAAAHRVYRAALAGLVPGAEFAYRISRDGVEVFSAKGRARKGAGQRHRFVVFGDCAAGTAEQRAIAHRAYRLAPDFVAIPGDIVYSQGRINEYRQKYFPVYNSDKLSAIDGAPLLRSIPFLAAPGNHDTATRDLAKVPDALAYFLYWDQPLNGPLGTVGATGSPTLLGAAPANHRAFLEGAGPSYPRMASFSFDYGDAHWTVIDSNTYADWTKPELSRWLARDLAAAKGATWRFVMFHHPPFQSSKAHADEQRMRLISKALEDGGADVVFTGHVHNYQRNYPMKFVPRENAQGKLADAKGRVEGSWTLDRSFDGRTRTVPDGVIHLVTGAGGARLYDTARQADPASWKEFTQVYIAGVNSLTVADVDGPTLTIRQVAPDGRELDHFVVTRPSGRTGR